LILASQSLRRHDPDQVRRVDAGRASQPPKGHPVETGLQRKERAPVWQAKWTVGGGGSKLPGRAFPSGSRFERDEMLSGFQAFNSTPLAELEPCMQEKVLDQLAERIEGLVKGERRPDRDARFYFSAGKRRSRSTSAGDTSA
jgi:hypothetical protein